MLKPEVVLDGPSTRGHLPHVGGSSGPQDHSERVCCRQTLSPVEELCSEVSHSSVFWCTAFCHLSLLLFSVWMNRVIFGGKKVQCR